MKRNITRGICAFLTGVLCRSSFGIMADMTPVKAEEVRDEDVSVDVTVTDDESDAEVEAEKNYILSFNGNGSTSGSMADITVKGQENYPVPKCTFKKKGYTFTGWYIQGSSHFFKLGEEIILSAWDDTADADSNVAIRLTAQWTLTPYKITYKLGGGTNAKGNPLTYTYDSKRKITLSEPTRDGYSFVGWYTSSSYKTRVKTISTNRTGNITLYAKWKKDKYAAYKNLLKEKYIGKNAFFWMGDINGDGVKELVIADYSGPGSYDWQYIICTMKKGKISDTVYESTRGTLKYYKSSKCIVNMNVDGGSLSATPGTSFNNYYTLSNGKFKYSERKSLKGTGKTISPKYKVTNTNINKYCK